jgi:alpha-beta hydrolase superfamily lysophospholipase
MVAAGMTGAEDYAAPGPYSPGMHGVVDGLAYTLWLPEGEPRGGLVVLHGAGSRKENHEDMARAARDAGFAAVCFDQRGHGASEGALDGRAIEDVATVAGLLPPGPVALRGSSMGGYMAIVAAERVGAAAVVAICSASADGLLRGLRAGDFAFRADRPALQALLAEHDAGRAVERMTAALLLMHAEGDEQVPVAHSIELERRSGASRTELVVVPGGHHRSVQHDPELQARALDWLRRVV